MPRMLPAFPDPETPTSEKAVFDSLATGLPDHWTVIHSRRITLPAEGKQRAFQSEADFLIIDPSRGVLVLEVKGGSEIRAADGIWYSTDHHGHEHKIRDPAQQAERVMHRIKQVIDKQRRLPGGRRLAWGVCFPGVTASQSPDPGLPRSHLLDQGDLAAVRSAVSRAFDAQDIDTQPMSQREVRWIIESMSPIFRFTRSLSATVNHQETSLIQLTIEQYRALEVLDGNRRVIVEGAAGTGKTLVAMEKCRRTAKDGKRCLFLCFNKNLARHLNEHASGFAVRTFHSEAIRLCREANITLPREQNTAEFWQIQVPELMQRAIEILPEERYDALFVDEGQDFEDLWWLPVQSLLSDQNKSLMYVFLDPVQDLYGRSLQLELGGVPARLSYNCRNTRAIGTYSGSFVGREPMFRDMTPTGDPVSRKTASGSVELIDILRHELHRIVTEGGVSNRSIVVLSPIKDSPAWQVRRAGPFELVDLDSPIRTSKQVRYSTIHGFKGLEADAIILIDFGSANLPDASRLLHVATSRAKHILTVIEAHS